LKAGSPEDTTPDECGLVRRLLTASVQVGIPLMVLRIALLNDVAELLLEIQFHNKKAVVSCFVAAEPIAQLLRLELTCRESLFLEASSSPASSKLATTASSTSSAQKDNLNTRCKLDARLLGNLPKQ